MTLLGLDIRDLDDLRALGEALQDHGPHRLGRALAFLSFVKAFTGRIQ